jgi:Ca2+/Na+ antiporter
VFASLSAASGSSEGFYMAAATLMGSGIFISAIITSLITMVIRKEIKVTPAFFVRDIIFYILSCILLLYGLVIKQVIDKPLSYMFLGLYLFYVVFVIL